MGTPVQPQIEFTDIYGKRWLRAEVDGYDRLAAVLMPTQQVRRGDTIVDTKLRPLEGRRILTTHYLKTTCGGIVEMHTSGGGKLTTNEDDEIAVLVPVVDSESPVVSRLKSEEPTPQFSEETIVAAMEAGRAKYREAIIAGDTAKPPKDAADEAAGEVLGLSGPEARRALMDFLRDRMPDTREMTERILEAMGVAGIVDVGQILDDMEREEGEDMEVRTSAVPLTKEQGEEMHRIVQDLGGVGAWSFPFKRGTLKSGFEPGPVRDTMEEVSMDAVRLVHASQDDPSLAQREVAIWASETDPVQYIAIYSDQVEKARGPLSDHSLDHILTELADWEQQRIDDSEGPLTADDIRQQLLDSEWTTPNDPSGVVDQVIAAWPDVFGTVKGGPPIPTTGSRNFRVTPDGVAEQRGEVMHEGVNGASPTGGGVTAEPGIQVDEERAMLNTLKDRDYGQRREFIATALHELIEDMWSGGGMTDVNGVLDEIRNDVLAKEGLR